MPFPHMQMMPPFYPYPPPPSLPHEMSAPQIPVLSAEESNQFTNLLEKLNGTVDSIKVPKLFFSLFLFHTHLFFLLF
jgi:hypothetical protein